MSGSIPMAADGTARRTGPLAGAALFGAAIAIAAGNFLVLLGSTITNVSVPTIAGGLGVSANQGTWVITSYAIAEAITVPLTGGLRENSARSAFLWRAIWDLPRCRWSAGYRDRWACCLSGGSCWVC